MAKLVGPDFDPGGGWRWSLTPFSVWNFLVRVKLDYIQNLVKIGIELAELFKFEVGQIKNRKKIKSNRQCSSRLLQPRLGLG